MAPHLLMLSQPECQQCLAAIGNLKLIEPKSLLKPLLGQFYLLGRFSLTEINQSQFSRRIGEI